MPERQQGSHFHQKTMPHNQHSPLCHVHCREDVIRAHWLKTCAKRFAYKVSSNNNNSPLVAKVCTVSPPRAGDVKLAPGKVARGHSLHANFSILVPLVWLSLFVWKWSAHLLSSNSPTEFICFLDIFSTPCYLIMLSWEHQTTDVASCLLLSKGQATKALLFWGSNLLPGVQNYSQLHFNFLRSPLEWNIWSQIGLKQMFNQWPDLSLIKKIS